MKIKLNNGSPASEEMWEPLEAALKCQLSDSYKSFLRKHDGAEPESNWFKIGDKNASGVHQFIPVSEILKKRSYIENIPAQAYPVASDAFGNFIFLDEKKDGAVFFWHHEMPEDIDWLAASFGEFIELLEPDDSEPIELKPGQVKKVWVDPDFLRWLQEKGYLSDS